MGCFHSVTASTRKPSRYVGLEDIEKYAARRGSPSSAHDILIFAEGQQQRFHGIFDDEFNSNYNIKRDWQLEKEQVRRELSGRELRKTIADMDREMAHQLLVNSNKFRARKQRALSQFENEWNKRQQAKGYPFWGRKLNY
ncbi:uncharacterized protein CTRU02_201130 [Colletotrichum truncatum]|uniref:Uncharacterized protein n=1 Tax=Colletotrichum truncatum TaxID=5467 RepID=A0ACC3ZGF3_COLTU|nr:uncharacterized protein CTRU02_12443 [Colletotrichum truncatum]KAF6784738.1 hypothetical protein CTRU02_12443 [Colletotrichum truncatum]